jgi:ankyrin repeat protein
LGCWSWPRKLHRRAFQSRRRYFCPRKVCSDEMVGQCGHSTDGDNLSRDGTSALYWAASRGHAACIQALLKNGADVNVLDRCVQCLITSAC